MGLSPIERAIQDNLRRRAERRKSIKEELFRLFDTEKQSIDSSIREQADADGYQVMVSVGGTELGKQLLDIARHNSLPQKELNDIFASWIRKQEWHYFVKTSSVTPHYQLLIIRWLE